MIPAGRTPGAATGCEAPLVVPRSAVPYALLQRTGMQRWNLRRSRLSRIPLLRYETSLVFLESRMRRARVTSAFGASIAADLGQLRPHLPERVTSVLDIGCGIAGIDVALHRHYGGDLRIHLLDRTQTDPAAFAYGMGAAERFYNSLDAARDLLVANGVSPDRLSLWEAAPDFTFPAQVTFDLVISLLSWGHHYPIETYLGPVRAAMRPGGRVIVDVRKGTGGEETLRDAFTDVVVIATTDKHRRLVATR